MLRALMLLALATPSTAFALKCGVVDFERVAQETSAGKAAQSRLEQISTQRMSSLQAEQQALEADFKDYQAQAAVLAPAEAQKREQVLMQKDQELRLKAQQAQTEVQQAYMGEMQTLIEGFRTVATKLGANGSYDVILDKTVVVYAVGDCRDLTSEVIQRANAAQ